MITSLKHFTSDAIMCLAVIKWSFCEGSLCKKWTSPATQKSQVRHWPVRGQVGQHIIGSFQVQDVRAKFGNADTDLETSSKLGNSRR